MGEIPILLRVLESKEFEAGQLCPCDDSGERYMLLTTVMAWSLDWVDCLAEDVGKARRSGEGLDGGLRRVGRESSRRGASWESRETNSTHLWSLSGNSRLCRREALFLDKGGVGEGLSGGLGWESSWRGHSGANSTQLWSLSGNSRLHWRETLFLDKGGGGVDGMLVEKLTDLGSDVGSEEGYFCLGLPP